MPLKPEKSTDMKWSMRRPVWASTVLMLHAAAPATSPALPPIANASLIFALCGSEVLPPPISQDGMSTQESRGKDTTAAHFRFAGMCSTISVSDCMVVRSLPYLAFAPSRLSEPTTMMFFEPGLRFSGRSSPSLSSTAAESMLLLRSL